jgi:hypothetical protein
VSPGHWEDSRWEALQASNAGTFHIQATLPFEEGREDSPDSTHRTGVRVEKEISQDCQECLLLPATLHRARETLMRPGTSQLGKGDHRQLQHPAYRITMAVVAFMSVHLTYKTPASPWACQYCNFYVPKTTRGWDIHTQCLKEKLSLKPLPESHEQAQP